MIFIPQEILSDKFPTIRQKLGWTGPHPPMSQYSLKALQKNCSPLENYGPETFSPQILFSGRMHLPHGKIEQIDKNFDTYISPISMSISD